MIKHIVNKLVNVKINIKEVFLMIRRPVKEDYFINDIWCAIPYKNNKDKIRITKELEANRRRRGIKFIEDDDRGNIIYSHVMEEGAFH